MKYKIKNKIKNICLTWLYFFIFFSKKKIKSIEYTRDKRIAVIQRKKEKINNGPGKISKQENEE
jgi:hypothetical protein